ncbi:MAG: hypothetical protein H6Q90_4499 [Deltaproteobacteria bacterium]|nr:hypothetical protein [Deltaproteobacteria bacterium]
MRGRLLAIAAIVLAGLGALAIRVVLEGRSALAEGDQAMTEQRLNDAIAAWERAARWYLPGAPHVDEAYDRLVEVARHDHNLTAWRAIRSAAVVTRSLWTPHEAELAEANAAIAQLLADDPAGALAAGDDRAARLAWHQDRLARDPRPTTSAAALAISGIAGWLLGLGVLVRRGVDAKGKLAVRPTLLGLLITMAGIAAWVVGLYSV